MMNVDSCNHICTDVPPEMKATIDELTKRATEKEAGMVCQVVHCHMYVQYICMYVLVSHIRTVYVHTVCSIICIHIIFTCTCGPCAVEVHGDCNEGEGSQARTAPAVQTEWKSR